MDLQTLAHSFRLHKLSSERAKFHDILEQLSVPLSAENHILIKALDGKHTAAVSRTPSTTRISNPAWPTCWVWTPFC